MGYMVEYDSEGRIIGFYHTDIHQNIPATAIPISDDQWRACVDDPQNWRVKNGALVNEPPPPVRPSLEEALAQIRAIRNEKLIACDWTQLPDVPMTPEQRAAWAAYRQALRDFPATCDPLNPVWPKPPAP